MFETVRGIFDYLVAVQIHPLVSLAVLVVIALGRQRYEEPEPDPVKKRLIARRVFHAMLGVSVIAQLALYWPRTAQGVAICLVMALIQVGVASLIYTYVEKWGVMDRVGRIVQRKLDDKGAADGTPTG